MYLLAAGTANWYDDFGDYETGFETSITEIGCMTEVKHKFFNLHAANKSQLAVQDDRGPQRKLTMPPSVMSY
ncbi:hypothetical protein D3C85_1286820 [compost metagenome]